MMARVTVYVPDQLRDRVRDELPGLVISQVLQAALVSKLDCRHDELSCARCAAQVDRLELVDAALGAFYGEAWYRLGELAGQAGTAEGAVAIFRRVGEDFGISCVAHYPLVRSTREARRQAMDRKVTELLPPAARAKRRRTA